MKRENIGLEGTLCWMYHQSYLGEIDERPRNLDSLVFLVNKLRHLKGKDSEISQKGVAVHTTREYLYIEFLTDALEKLGFVYLARDQLKQSRKDLHVSKYHIYNSIFDCKSFLDTMAGLLNHHYQLGMKGIFINLCNHEFKEELEKKNPDLMMEIGRFELWLTKLNEWRNKLIHRQGIFIPFTDKGAEYMLAEPWNFSDLAEHFLKEAPVAVRTIDFCEENLRCARLIMEIICTAICNDLRKKISSLEQEN